MTYPYIRFGEKNAHVAFESVQNEYIELVFSFSIRSEFRIIGFCLFLFRLFSPFAM